MIEREKLYPVSEQGGERLATLSPDGKKVAFIRDNNLFISDLNGTITPLQQMVRITTLLTVHPTGFTKRNLVIIRLLSGRPMAKNCMSADLTKPCKEFNLLKYKGLSPELEEGIAISGSIFVQISQGRRG